MARYCQICKNPLESERIELPDTVLCIQHGNEIKEFGGEFMLVNEVGHTSKEGGLKKTGQKVTTKKVRHIEAFEKLRRKWEDEQWAAKEQADKQSG